MPRHVLWAYFELGTEPVPAQNRFAVTNPAVLHGGITLDAFVDLLEHWADDQVASLGDWLVLAPAGIDFLRTQGPWPSGDPSFRVRLLGAMPNSDAPYLVERLEGTGRQFDGNDYNDFYRRMMKQRGTPDKWQFEFMHPSIAIQNFTVLVIEIPDPLAITVGLDHDGLTAGVEVRYRAPDDETSFEVRVGEEPWAPDRAPLAYQAMEAERDGWSMIRYSTPVGEPGNYIAWLTRTQTDEDFDWRIPFLIGDPDPLATRVRDLLNVWFGLNNHRKATTLAEALEPRPANPAKGTPSGRLFEVALHAACTGLGLPTLYGDQTLTTPGVDIIAFDWQRGLVFAISSVTDTNIDLKLTKWLDVRDRVITVLVPYWEVRPIITTNRSLTDCSQAHIQSACRQGVLVCLALRISPALRSHHRLCPSSAQTFGSFPRIVRPARNTSYFLQPIATGGSSI
jgi:hypothetical protein